MFLQSPGKKSADAHGGLVNRKLSGLTLKFRLSRPPNPKNPKNRLISTPGCAKAMPSMFLKSAWLDYISPTKY